MPVLRTSKATCSQIDYRHTRNQVTSSTTSNTMKQIPNRAEAEAKQRKKNSPLTLFAFEEVHDTIVDAIEAGRIHPGNRVYLNDGRTISQPLQDKLKAVFSAAGWPLHFYNFDEASRPHSVIYIAGDSADRSVCFLPYIRQPDGYKVPRF